MSKVAVGKGIGTALEPHDDGMQLAKGTKPGVVNVEVNDICRDQEAQTRV